MTEDIALVVRIAVFLGVLGSLGWLCVWTIRRNAWAGVVLTIAIIGIAMISGAMRQ